MIETRNSLLQGYEATIVILRAEGDQSLAEEIRSFVNRMPPVRTELEILADVVRRDARDRAADPQTRTR
jgi:hypothetical protein